MTLQDKHAQGLLDDVTGLFQVNGVTHGPQVEAQLDYVKTVALVEIAGTLASIEWALQRRLELEYGRENAR